MDKEILQKILRAIVGLSYQATQNERDLAALAIEDLINKL